MNKTEQHILINTTQYKQALENIIDGRKVLEFGVGTGTLTQLLLEAGASQIIGYEFQEGLCQIEHERFALHVVDYTKCRINKSYNDRTDFCLVTNPAYSTLDYIQKNILPSMHNAILMIPSRCVEEFKELGFRELFSLDGNSFDPPAEGTHHIMLRGFLPRFVDLYFEVSKATSQTISERVNEISAILPEVALCGFGGIPFKMIDNQLHWSGNPINCRVLQNNIIDGIGLSAILTYANKKNKSLQELGEICTERKETWAYHWMTATMVFASQAPEVQLSFARDGRFCLGWTIEKNYTGKLFTASASLHDWLKFSSKRDDLSFDEPTRKAMNSCFNILESILP